MSLKNGIEEVLGFFIDCSGVIKPLTAKMFHKIEPHDTWTEVHLLEQNGTELFIADSYVLYPSLEELQLAINGCFFTNFLL